MLQEKHRMQKEACKALNLAEARAKLLLKLEEEEKINEMLTKIDLKSYLNEQDNTTKNKSKK